MTRAEILAETLARLEAERYSAPVRAPQYRRARAADLPPVTAEQAAHNRRVLEIALGIESEVVDINRRRAS